MGRLSVTYRKRNQQEIRRCAFLPIIAGAALTMVSIIMSGDQIDLLLQNQEPTPFWARKSKPGSTSLERAGQPASSRLSAKTPRSSRRSAWPRPETGPRGRRRDCRDRLVGGAGALRTVDGAKVPSVANAGNDKATGEACSPYIVRVSFSNSQSTGRWGRGWSNRDRSLTLARDQLPLTERPGARLSGVNSRRSAKPRISVPT